MTSTASRFAVTTDDGARVRDSLSTHEAAAMLGISVAKVRAGIDSTGRCRAVAYLD